LRCDLSGEIEGAICTNPRKAAPLLRYKLKDRSEIGLIQTEINFFNNPKKFAAPLVMRTIERIYLAVQDSQNLIS
jgi:hypothetical protein